VSAQGFHEHSLKLNKYQQQLASHHRMILSHFIGLDAKRANNLRKKTSQLNITPNYLPFNIDAEFLIMIQLVNH
jgi:hypothetical protein